jgi:hypothetical protein
LPLPLLSSRRRLPSKLLAIAIAVAFPWLLLPLSPHRHDSRHRLPLVVSVSLLPPLASLLFYFHVAAKAAPCSANKAQVRTTAEPRQPPGTLSIGFSQPRRRRFRYQVPSPVEEAM